MILHGILLTRYNLGWRLTCSPHAAATCRSFVDYSICDAYDASYLASQGRMLEVNLYALGVITFRIKERAGGYARGMRSMAPRQPVFCGGWVGTGCSCAQGACFCISLWGIA